MKIGDKIEGFTVKNITSPHIKGKESLTVYLEKPKEKKIRKITLKQALDWLFSVDGDVGRDGEEWYACSN